MKVGKIELEYSPEKIKNDLGNLCNLALETGASDVRIVDPSKEVFLDYRAQYKCALPKCPFYGTNINCPPYSLSMEEMKRLVNSYEVALLIAVKLPSFLVAPNSLEDYRAWSNSPDLIKMLRNHFRIVGIVESTAYELGYYFATSFGGGSCKSAFCPNEPCQALDRGNRCRHYLKARPSMEGSGIDVFKTATYAGWDIYPVGRKNVAVDIPHGLGIGLTLLY